jgi:hypothetical protein
MASGSRVCRAEARAGQGWEAVGRLRLSAGLEADAPLGGFRRRTPTDLDFPALSCDAALTARLRIAERLPAGKDAFAQFALLYTTPEGARRIRRAPAPPGAGCGAAAWMWRA